jgi:hypothetical protein
LGFEILGFTNTTETTKIHWENAIEKYKIPWTTVSDFKGLTDSEIMKSYNISAFPVNYLLSPDGIIIDKELYGDALFRRLGYLLEN